MPDKHSGPEVRGTEHARSDDTASAQTGLREADQDRSAEASVAGPHLLEEQAEGHGAIAAFQRAIRRGQAAPRFLLGDLLAESDDPSGLIKAYRVAAERGDQGAAYQLGLLYSQRGDLEAARSAFATADTLGHAWAALALGELLERTGDGSGAIAAYRRAAGRRLTVAHTRLEALLAATGAAIDEPPAASGPTDEAGLAQSAKRPTKRRLAWSAGAVAAPAALLVVALLTLLPTTKPAARSGTVPATRAGAGGVGRGASQSTGLPAFGAPATAFSAKQLTLLNSVPGAIRAQCFPQAHAPLPRSDASIHCFSFVAGVTVLYYRYSSLPVLRSIFHNYRAWFAARHKLRDCAGRTQGTYFQGSAGSAIAGRWTCFYNDRTIPQSACIDWVDYGLLTFGSACQADGDFSALASWWTRAGPVPPATGGLTNRF
ncbi:MAG TPA: hypothetical protein VKS25_16220 [Solirubrobacteraceae bacterium]|nr:hypothetical protein [Solirubrobacteraceae bacterium]